jgi:ATP-binding protein involved in chromosome partitioning
MSEFRQQILETLNTVQAPGASVGLIEAGAVQDLSFDDGVVKVAVAVTATAPGATAELEPTLKAALEAIDGVDRAEVRVQTMLSTVSAAPPQSAPTEPEEPAWTSLIPDVTHVIAVASGKGGVGKSTVSANLALALARRGHDVGLLDADIYGPSQQMMMGASGEPEAGADGKIIPLNAPGGVKVMSFGFIVDPDQPVIWRGPMLQKALEQFFGDVVWGKLDYLIIDLPPGTGDVALTLCQNVAMAGAVIVTTPQDVALVDARKALNMFRRLETPVLGVVENMSGFTCPSCGHHEAIFGSGGGRATAEELELPFLGSVPLDPAVVLGGDSGRPVVAERPESAAAKAFFDAADSISSRL